MDTSQQKGFTIVELLIVVVVIAILAAITIVSFNGISKRAKESSAQSTVSQAAKKIMAHAVVNSDTYPASLDVVGLADSDQSKFQYSYNNTASPKTYCVTVTVQDISYYVGTMASKPTAGACPGHGAGGVAAITNLSQNPSYETDLTGIGASAGVTATRSTAQAQSGSNSLLLTRTGTGDDFALINLTLDVDTPYRISAWVYLTATGSTGNNRRFWIYNQSGGAATVDVAYPAPGSWQRISQVFTPTTNSLVTLRIYAVTGASLYIDSVMVTKESNTYTYADGNSANWVWAGAQNNSTSTGPPL